MADLEEELETRQYTWHQFIKYAFWSAGVIVLVLVLMWIFLL